MKKNLKKITALIMIALIVSALSGCGSPAVPERLIGDWQCDPLPSNGSIDTSFYSISIQADGTFSLDDNNTGKPAMSGTMEGDDTGKLGIVEIHCDGKNFDPPACWSSLSKDARLRYKTDGSDTIKFGYVGIWLTFRK